MEKVIINRFHTSDKQVLGEMIHNGIVIAKTLELAWNENERRMSCIPWGTYQVKYRWSSKYGDHYHIQDVPNRDMILIHTGNYHFQILGCILVGSEHVDINHDGYQDVTNSRSTLKKIMALLPREFELQII